METRKQVKRDRNVGMEVDWQKTLGTRTPESHTRAVDLNIIILSPRSEL